MDKADPKYDRLLLTESRIQGLADSLREVALLPDPTGEVLKEREANAFARTLSTLHGINCD